MTIDAIGNTPIRRCDFLSTRYGTNVYIKEEFYNLGMSSKVRPALFMIQDAIDRRCIRPGGTFVEASSGNTGLGITLIARQLGFQSKIFVTKSCSDEKIQQLEEAGAHIEICANSNGLQDFLSTQFCAQAFASKQANCYFTNQYYNTQNIRAHYKTTGPEVWRQTGGQVTHFISGIGTGGTISGVGRFLKEQRQDIQIWGVEPQGSILQYYLERGVRPTKGCVFDAIEGIGRSFIPGSFDPQPVDQIFQVSELATRGMATRYRLETDKLCGFSSAAILAALETYQQDMALQRSDTVLLLFPDHGSRYLGKLYAEQGVNNWGELNHVQS